MLRAELLKVRSMKMPWILLTVIAAIYLLSVILAFTFTDALSGEEPYVGPLVALNQILFPILALAFGAWVGGGEYQWGTWRAVLAHDNRRALLLGTKLLVMVGLVLVASIVTYIAAMLLASFAAVLRGNSVDLSGLVGLTIGPTIQHVVYALVGFTLAALTKNIAAGVTIGFAWLVIVDALLRLVSRLQDRVDLVPFLITTPVNIVRDQFIPANWLIVGVATSGELPSEPTLGDPAAWAALVFWCALLVAVAFITFMRRDMTD